MTAPTLLRPTAPCALSVLAAGEESASESWAQIARTGTWRGHAMGEFTFDAKVYEQIVSNFAKTSNRAVPVDFEHAAELGPRGSVVQSGAPAQAWVIALRYSDDQLEALFRWVPGQPGRMYVRQGAYRYVSPAVMFGAIDRISGKPIGAELSSVALTNRPFLDGLRPVSASAVAASALAIAVPVMTATERLEARAGEIARTRNVPLSKALVEAHREAMARAVR